MLLNCGIGKLMSIIALLYVKTLAKADNGSRLLGPFTFNK